MPNSPRVAHIGQGLRFQSTHPWEFVVKPIRTLTLESLESRLAPALFFASGAALTVIDAVGNDAQNLANETAAQTATGATKAILLNAGDSLVFDTNDNHIRDAKERVLVSVTAGKAMVFLSNGPGPTASAFDENEITGLAVSNGFIGTVNTDVNGSITTTLDATGQFTQTVLQNASIAGLNIAGRVSGDLVAGKNVSNVRIGSGLFTPAPQASVARILLGTAGAQDSVHYGSPGNAFALSFTQSAGANGGNVTNVRLENGTSDIEAGDGGAITSGFGNGGNGGSVVGLTVVNSPGGFSLATGKGGSTVHGNGGSAGNLSQSSISFQSNSTTPGAFFLGFGGDSNAGNGGNGGSVLNTTINMIGDGLVLAVNAGVGGQASGMNTVAGRGGKIVGSTIRLTGSLGRVVSGNLIGGVLSMVGGTGGNGVGTSGGPGGGIINSRIEAIDAEGSIPILFVSGGSGGDSTTDHGGAGGAVSGSTILVNDTLGIDVNGTRAGQATITTGAGGAGVTRGGDGGAFNGNDVRFLGLVDLKNFNTLAITAGDGGSISGNGIGGHGGNFGTAPVNGVPRKNSIVLNSVADGATSNRVSIRAGNGGGESTATSPGSGGAGGNLSSLNLELLQGANFIELLSGDGGHGGTIGNGGAAGSISNVAMNLHGLVSEGTQIFAGDGGDAGSTKGTAGVGGSLANFDLKLNASFGQAEIDGGSAGSSRDANGAAGGNVTGVTFENDGPIDQVTISAGFGTGLLSGNGTGGSGGSLSNVVVNSFGDVDDLSISAGGSSLHNGSGSGGKGGAFSNVTINNYGHSDFIQVLGGSGGDAGDAGGKGDGGTAGPISNVTINDFSSDGAAVVLVASQPGGAGLAGGNGGGGGAISNVSLFGPRTDFHVRAAAGGSGTAQGGNGGGISNVHGNVGSLRIDAGDGGGTGPNGKGGDGGPVTGVSINAVGKLVRWIIAGNGGNGGVLGGNGGSIAKVQVAGDIGDFASPFGLPGSLNSNSGMGGLITGQAGTGGAALNGSISQVNVTRITAVYAGRPAANNITAANAVRSLTMINAQVIGADVNHNELFDFTDAGPAGFNLGDGDTAIDGFVLVKHATNLTGLPFVPLKSISLVP